MGKKIWHAECTHCGANHIHVPMRKNDMTEPLKASASLGRVKVPGQTDQELAKSYLELLELRQQVRIAECGRAILIPALHDLSSDQTSRCEFTQRFRN